jgi:hypothetical protein
VWRFSGLSVVDDSKLGLYAGIISAAAVCCELLRLRRGIWISSAGLPAGSQWRHICRAVADLSDDKSRAGIGQTQCQI